MNFIVISALAITQINEKRDLRGKCYINQPTCNDIIPRSHAIYMSDHERRWLWWSTGYIT